MSIQKRSQNGSHTLHGTPLRLHVEVRGAVQGVGFRPYIHRLATELGLVGWVNNNSQGVRIEVEGNRAALEAFLLRLEPEKPPHASIQSLEPSYLDAVGYTDFQIRASDARGAKSALILPDFALCPDCLRELFDPADRRYRYPFINCTHCGPRYSIIETLPYDRPNTTMRRFPMCDACRAEYEDPLNRRFHAQPNACPECGPSLAWWSVNGEPLAAEDAALLAAAQAIRDGAIVGVKGIGGFHLMVDARNEVAVMRLRARKHREEKPFALMAPSLAHVRLDCDVSPLEERLLLSAEAPIVLLHRKESATVAPAVAPHNPNLDTGCRVLGVGCRVAPAVAPRNPNLGVMLPYTPLHHLLMSELGFPVVATSGNRSDEPICIDEQEAVERLAGIADFLLVHDRPIARPIDDSVARIMLDREMILRRSRGYAPLPIPISVKRLALSVKNPAEETPGEAKHSTLNAQRSTLNACTVPVLAVGAHLKNTVALGVDGQAFLSQHIGDLETEEAYAAFQRAIADLARLHAVEPERIVCDLHPDYLSTRYAERSGLPITQVQHHDAHVLACMAENGIDEPALGVSWDGTGYGEDGLIWGGEFLGVDRMSFARLAHLRPFGLPGGDQAIREPRRAAFALLYEMFGDAVCEREDLAPVRAFSHRERIVMRSVLSGGLNLSRTTSMGRLFDVMASLTDVRQFTRYEGQAAMEFEAIGERERTDIAYTLCPTHVPGEPEVLDWEPLVREVLEDLEGGVPVGVISARFHNALVEAIVDVAHGAGVEPVILTGGCFLNRRLLESAVMRLRAEGFRPYWHQRVPPGDGSIALGQLAAVQIA